jgi:signal transduction histidine kinase
MHHRPDALEGDARRWWWAVGGGGLALSLAYALVPERYTALRELGIYAAVTTGSWIAVLVGVRLYRPAAPYAWTLIGLGLLAWSIGDVIFSAYDVASREVPYPSSADFFYLVGYLLMAAGLAVAAHARRATREWKIALDAVAVTLAAILLEWVYIVRPVIDGNETGLSKLISVLYPTADLLLTLFAALLFLGTAWRTRSMQLLVTGLAVTLIADIAYYAPSSPGLGVGDVVYLLALTCIALAALHPSMSALTDPTQDTAELDSRKKLALLGVVLAVPLAVLVVQDVRGAPLFLPAVIAIFTALVIVVVLRFDRMLTDARRAAETAGTLSRFSAGLLAGTDDDELVASADRAVDELVVHGEARVVALPEHDDAEHVLVKPVKVESKPVATIVADTDPREAATVEETLASVASQLSLALERLRGLERERQLVASLSKQNEQLSELDRMKNRFVSSTSHELRTPLTSMVGYLELLLGGEAGELTEDQRHFLEIVSRNCDRLNRLVDDVLFVGRADSERLTLDPSDVDVAELVQSQVTSQEAAARLKHIDLRCEAKEGLPTITADATRLAQVLDNLLNNALKFTPEGGTVTATVTGDAEDISIAVSDSGVGIPADELPRIFERFFRASTSATISGTGLGLPIVKTIAEAHGGTVSAVSGVGTGTTFTVELPVHPAAAALIARATMEKEAQTT